MTETTPAERSAAFDDALQNAGHALMLPAPVPAMARVLTAFRDEYRAELLAAATVPASAPADRAAIEAAALREAAEDYATLTDQNEAYDREEGDLDEAARLQYGTVRDIVIGLRRKANEIEAAASGPGGAAGETQQDDAPYPPSVEWRTQTQRRGDHWITWHGVQYELAEARSDFADTVERDGRRHAWRLIRETTTYTVDAEQPAAVSQPGKEATS